MQLMLPLAPVELEHLWYEALNMVESLLNYLPTFSLPLYQMYVWNVPPGFSDRFNITQHRDLKIRLLCAISEERSCMKALEGQISRRDAAACWERQVICAGKKLCKHKPQGSHASRLDEALRRHCRCAAEETHWRHSHIQPHNPAPTDGRFNLSSLYLHADSPYL